MKLVKHLVAAAVASGLSFSLMAADLIVYNAKIQTFDGKEYSAFSVTNGRFEQLTTDSQSLLAQKTAKTQLIDAQGRRVIPGINDSHLHVVRGGRFYNLETRWEGLTSLKDALALLKKNVEVTPEGQWARVVGGFSPYQFKEKRLPTSAELTEIAPNTPVFVLHLYSGAVLNKKAMQVLGISKDSVAPKDSYYEKDAQGELTGRLIADPNPTILYKTIAALPQLSQQDQLNSSQQFYNKLLSLGVTSVVDAGGGGHDHFARHFPMAFGIHAVLYIVAGEGELAGIAPALVLENDAANGVRVVFLTDAIEDHTGNGKLATSRLAPRLEIDAGGEAAEEAA